MKYLKKFNEELKGSTFRSAALKLKQLGHTRRSQEIESYAIDVEEREKKSQIEQRQKDMAQFGAFALTYYKVRWDSSKKAHIETPIMSGNFYLEPGFDYGWFGDMVYDWIHDGSQYGLFAPIEIGTSPADDLTIQKWNELESAGSFSEESWQGVYFGTRLMAQICKEGEVGVTSNGVCAWESRDSDIFVFSSRAEAMRFKKMIVEALEGKNLFGKDPYSPGGLYGDFEKYFENDKKWRDEKVAKGEVYETVFVKEDMPKLANTVRTGLSINQLYRN